MTKWIRSKVGYEYGYKLWYLSNLLRQGIMMCTEVLISRLEMWEKFYLRFLQDILDRW